MKFFFKAAQWYASFLGALLLGASFLGTGAQAAPLPQVVVLPLGPESWIRSGAAIGGQASNDELSILKVERSLAGGGVERIAIRYGDKHGRAMLGPAPGYFHLLLDRGGRRLALDLAQVSRTAVDRHDLEAIFQASKYVSAVDIAMDPEDGSTHLSLSLREPIEAYALAGSVVDPAGARFKGLAPTAEIVLSLRAAFSEKRPRMSGAVASTKTKSVSP